MVCALSGNITKAPTGASILVPALSAKATSANEPALNDINQYLQKYIRKKQKKAAPFGTAFEL